MAAFRNVPEEWQRLDWILFQNGWVSLYQRKEILIADISWFRSQRYRVIDFDCSKWADEHAAHSDLKAKFHFPDSYANTPGALRDALAAHDITGIGQVVVLHQFDAVDQELGQSLLNSFADSARLHMLRGERLLVLAQLNTPENSYITAGKSTVSWNPLELL
ncbi:barstar family protein [Pontibacter qinzhouensis]|uniref:Barstar family protein n=1 Tax=Pontibacter qinzhouensis TaxID=2603253 RepID=A0A5C8JLA8_9BACT|nr:barstar family protein [Pontibacter qinzhouensis]TXK37653.1 barstar family protein [Pontibacter qinzhouensis]